MIISRETEEIALNSANGTCINGEVCVSPTAIPGTALVDGKCVLCCRYETTQKFNDLFDFGVRNTSNETNINPYTNITNEYHENVLLDKTDIHIYKRISGPFIRYDKNDYTLVDDVKVVQNFERPKTINWVKTLIDIERSTDPVPSKWFIAHCTTQKCKKKLFSIVDQQSATGMIDTVYNLGTNSLQCSYCKNDVEYIYSNEMSNLVQYNKEDYTKCSFCNTLIKFNVLQSPRTCTTCLNGLVKRAQDAKKVCLYCNVHVNTSRRGGNKSIKQSDGTVIYLCKVHSKLVINN